MKTTNLTGKTMQMASVEPASGEETHSLSEFNRQHAQQIRRTELERAAYRSRRKTDKVFESATILLILSTAVAAAVSLLTMVPH